MLPQFVSKLVARRSCSSLIFLLSTTLYMRSRTTIADETTRFSVPIKRFFLISIALLAPLTTVKFGELQTVEIYSFIAFGIVVAIVFRNRLCIAAEHDVLKLIKLYTLFLLIAAVLAAWALRLPTFPIQGTPLLKHAPFLSLARLTQLSLVIGTIVITTNILAMRPSLIALLCQCYVYGGVISCLYGIASWAALFAGVHLGGINIGGSYGETHRIDGFFVEGGPFGVYLVSVILVSLFRRQVLHRGDSRAYWAQMGLFVVTLAAAESKAAVLLGIVVGLYALFVTKRLRYAFALVPIFVALASFSHLTSRLHGYAESYLHFKMLAHANPHDTSLVEGRVMAAILVPIMVAHHPIAGIGVGNYSLQRNNPSFLGSLPIATTWDLPGLGLLGDAAEFGIPLLIYIYWLLWRPVTISRQMGAPPLVIILAAYQTFAHTLGVQLTFVYPWIVSAIALGYSLSLKRSPESASGNAQLFRGAVQQLPYSMPLD